MQTSAFNYRSGLIKYLSLKVADFTQPNRSPENLVWIIQSLNGIVNDVLCERSIKPADRIVLPTHEGMCIALLNQKSTDSHLECAIAITRLVDTSNRTNQSNGKTYSLQIGMHEANDMVIRDLHDRDSIIGQGISHAHSLMNLCQPGLSNISEEVYRSVNNEYQVLDGHSISAFKADATRPFSYYSLQLDSLGKGSIAVILDRSKVRIGRLLMQSDINSLKPGDYVFSFKEGIGVVEQINSIRNPAPGSYGVIVFEGKKYSMVLTPELRLHFWHSTVVIGAH